MGNYGRGVNKVIKEEIKSELAFAEQKYLPLKQGVVGIEDKANSVCHTAVGHKQGTLRERARVLYLQYIK